MPKPKISKRQQAARDFRRGLKLWSLLVRERDGHKCCTCGKTEYLQAHHLLPKERYQEHALNIENGLTLCPSCHKYGKHSAHRNPFWIVEWLKNNRPAQYAWVMERI